jgi:hypothetical protein
VLHQNLGGACGFKPLETSVMQALRERCRAYVADGHLELFKMTVKYGGRIGREQQGYQPPEDLPL